MLKSEGIRVEVARCPGGNSNFIFNPERSYVTVIRIIYSQILVDNYQTSYHRDKDFLEKHVDSLAKENKGRFLEVLEQVGNLHNQESLYPDILTKIYKSNLQHVLDLPKNNFQKSEIQNLVTLYLIKTQFSKDKVVASGILEKLQKVYPTLHLRDSLFMFGADQTVNGKSTFIPIVELGWYHMPSGYNRLNIYSGIVKNGNDAPKESNALETFTSTVAHLYTDALNNQKPLLGKFTTTNAEVRFCSYINKDLLRWQLRSLSEYFQEPVKITSIQKGGDVFEFRLFNGKVGIRTSHEKLMSKQSRAQETMELKEIIESLE